ncbi:prolyl oligopeptidase family domain-containing [Trichoderma arundinaceum]|uniref:Dipeptidyl-peptidase V n=1 Tax=Trichoderma arundinaceum TaxID=490622 RepID=A0A395NVL7_TRIAR|nr:prolyl oligopeptidase family domain-containing [Trichoderma arundinaceum]
MMNTKEDNSHPRRPIAGAQNLTSTDEWNHAHDWFMQLHGPSFGRVSNAEDLRASPDGTRIAFTASIWNSFQEGSPTKRVCLVDVTGESKGIVQCVTQGPNADKLPKWSSDGKILAFLSDRACKGHFRLYAMTIERPAEARLVTTGSLEGVIEDFEWSPDGNVLLYRLAAYGLSISGFEGSGTLVQSGRVSSPEWMPTVKTAAPPSQHRSLWINIWSFCWAGSHHAFALVSTLPTEAGHKESSLVRIDLSNGSEVTLRPRDELLVGMLASTPSGSDVALIESVGSERVKIVGNVVLINSSTHKKTILPSNNVDVGSLAWIGNHRLLAVGLRNMDSVALEIDTSTQEVRELWSTSDSCGGLPGFARATWVPSKGFAVLGDSKMINWQANDGLDLYGRLYLPVAGTAPYRTILYVHGGPFGAFVDNWLGYNNYIPWLVAHGYAVFYPNPRGSVGRGAEFAAAVKGDIGGVDASDLLSGMDYLVEAGLADPSRLDLIGGSYGGYMTTWLVTQTARFAAAVAGSPVSDYKLQWLCGDLRQQIIGDQIYVKDSLAERRSPLANVQFCQTPTLLIAGAKDTCTPPEHARCFHTALMDQGVESICVEYPQEGHGVRSFPAKFDACVRVLDWFNTFCH